MTNNQDIQAHIMSLKREIFEMKATSMLAPRIKAFTFTYTSHPNGAHPQGHGVITYAEGEGDILTQAITMADHIFKPPVDNKQDIYVDYHAGNDIEVKLVSTRPILSVVELE